MQDLDIQEIIALSKIAAERILAIYRQPCFAVSLKEDRSFLTQADSESHAIICEGLKKRYPDIPVISEESPEFHDYAVRKNWNHFFLVDPLDGTKEFVNRNDEFTINIALIRHGQPVLGVINAPALDVIYYAQRGCGAYKIIKNKTVKLPLTPSLSKNPNELIIAVSRSHYCEKTENFIANLQSEGKLVTKLSAGSALKFGLVAEGLADVYPRFTPTMEWDTAAGQVLVSEVGKKITMMGGDEPLQYNKVELRNAGFIVA